MQPKIVQYLFVSLLGLLALTMALSADTSTNPLNSGKVPLVTHHPSIVTFDPPGSTSTFPGAITASEVIIGSYIDTTGVTHGFVRRPNGTFTRFDVPGSASTTPASVTPEGVITGWYSDSIGNTHGFLRTLDGSVTAFDGPPGSNILGSPFYPSGPPPSINPAGDIAGIYFDSTFVEHGFLRTGNGTFTTIDFPGAIATEALAINPSGVIVGDFHDPATGFLGFIRTPDGTLRVINPNAGSPAGINPAGVVTGAAADGSGGYVRSPDGTFILFSPPGSASTSPFAINSEGAITGYYCDAAGCHGFVRSPQGAITGFDPPGSTFTLAVAINPSGVITGAFLDSSGASHGFIRTP